MPNPAEPRSSTGLGVEVSRSSPTPSARLPALPVGSRVVHIGAPKTGTTAIQAAQGQLRAEHGVSVPGTPLDQARGALAVMGRSTGWAKDSQLVPGAYWDKLVRRVRAAPGTVFLSSEHLCEADPPTINRIINELADADVRVVLTLRPLARILPSAWQQYLKSGHELPYEQWLRSVLATPPKASITPSFWRRHDQAAVVERWAAAAGTDRLTVIVLDPDDRGLLLRSFGDLLGLPSGTLTETTAQQNRSMTAAEAELFRQVNIALRGHRLPYDHYANLIRYGAIMRTVEKLTPETDSAKLTTPSWALERAVELATGYEERIEALRPEGLTVVGDLRRLRDAPAPAEPDIAVPQAVPMSVAVEALLGAVSRTANGKAFFPDETDADPTAGARGVPGGGRSTPSPTDGLTFRQLSAAVVKHVRRAARRRVRRLRSSMPTRP